MSIAISGRSRSALFSAIYQKVKIKVGKLMIRKEILACFFTHNKSAISFCFQRFVLFSLTCVVRWKKHPHGAGMFSKRNTTTQSLAGYRREGIPR